MAKNGLAPLDAARQYLIRNLDTGEEWHVGDLWRRGDLGDVDTFGSLRATVVGASVQLERATTRFVLYEVRVEPPWTPPFLLRKRYSDFLKLHQELQQDFQFVGLLPPKVWFGNLTPDVVLFRQRALDLYLKQALRELRIERCGALKDFLMPVPRVSDAARSPDAPESGADAPVRRAMGDPSLRPGRSGAGEHGAEAEEIIETQRRALSYLQQENGDLRKALALSELQRQRLSYEKGPHDSTSREALIL